MKLGYNRRILENVGLKVYTTDSIIEETFIQEWTDFVLSHPRGNIFQTPEFYRIYLETINTLPLLFVLFDNNRLVGILLTAIYSEGRGIKRHLTSRSIIIGGPLIKDNNTESLGAILLEYKQRMRQRTIYTQFRNLWSWDNNEKKTFLDAGFSFQDHLNFIHDISLPIENQLMRIHKGRRKNIRRAIREGLVFKEVNDQEQKKECIDILRDTYKRIRLPLSDISLFNSSLNILSGKGWIKMFAAIDRDNIIATRMILCYNKKIYDWYAGNLEGFKDKYPNDFLPWKVMEWGNLNHFAEFDFGGAGNPKKKYGVRDFKMKFGGELVNFGRFMWINKPIQYRIGVIGIKLLKLF